MAQEPKAQPERSMHARVGRDNQRYTQQPLHSPNPQTNNPLTPPSHSYGPSGERLVAGIVPLSPDRTQVLLIQSSSRKGWVLPKGGWEADEATEADAAAREAWEEAGIHVTVGRDLGVIEERRSEAQIRKYGALAPRAAYRFFDGVVVKEEAVWPESHKRTRCWMRYARARECLAARPELLEALERSGVKRD